MTGHGPLIGVAPQRGDASTGSYGHEYVADIFLEAIVAAGGVPVMLPGSADESLIATYVDLCDGIAIPGGHRPHPSMWGEEPIAAATEYSPERDALEVPLVRMALAANKPLLGVCRGSQMINIALGGGLVQDLDTLPPVGEQAHWNHWNIHRHAAHEVLVDEGSLLCRVLGGRVRVQANSSHRQCMGTLGQGVVVCAHATDGVPEAVEVPGRRFALGVQWHPEFLWKTLDSDATIWRAFVAAAGAGE